MSTRMTRNCKWLSIISFSNILKIFLIALKITVFSDIIAKQDAIMNSRLHYISMRLSS